MLHVTDGSLTNYGILGLDNLLFYKAELKLEKPIKISLTTSPRVGSRMIRSTTGSGWISASVGRTRTLHKQEGKLPPTDSLKEEGELLPSRAAIPQDSARCVVSGDEQIGPGSEDGDDLDSPDPNGMEDESHQLFRTTLEDFTKKGGRPANVFVKDLGRHSRS